MCCLLLISRVRVFQLGVPLEGLRTGTAIDTHSPSTPPHFLNNGWPQDVKRSTVSIWLYEQLAFRIEGKIRGFDEFMNLVIDDAVEVRQATKTEEEKRRPLGQILLKGDNVSLIQAV
ncbi:hypothetical protein VI817_004916 [Penicillium citrinum]|nr:hypothetical protein VI817_004916 [Penicillium citrinum]